MREGRTAVRGRIVPRTRPVECMPCSNFLDIRLFDSPFLEESGGEEQDDGLLG